MKAKKKIFAVLSSAALFAGIMAGCSSNSDSASGEKESDQVTLTLLVDNQTNLDGMKAVTDAIEEKYDIKTEYELRPGGGEGDNLVKTRLATGDMTDLMAYNSGSLFQSLNPEKNFLDISEEPFVETIMDDAKEALSSNGKVYGIPATGFMAGGWFYNKKVYEELGLSVPTTWDELMANNEKIKEAGKVAVVGTYKDSWTAQLIVLADNYNVLQQHPNFAEEFTANKAKISTTPGALRSFEKLEEVFKGGYLNEDFLATGYEAGLKMLAEGQGAHYPMLTFALPMLAANYSEELNNIGFFPQPGESAEENGLTVWVPAGVYINKNTEHPEEAKQWMEFFVSQEGIDIYNAKIKPDGPPAIKGVSLPEDVYPAVTDMLPFFESGKTAPALEFLSPVKGPNLPQIATEVGSGISDAKAGAELYDKDVEKQAKQLGLEGW
jgi:raffinose/stachyose/melibiose transport system substrate-binding protein